MDNKAGVGSSLPPCVLVKYNDANEQNEERKKEEKIMRWGRVFVLMKQASNLHINMDCTTHAKETLVGENSDSAGWLGAN